MSESPSDYVRNSDEQRSQILSDKYDDSKIGINANTNSNEILNENKNLFLCDNEGIDNFHHDTETDSDSERLSNTENDISDDDFSDINDLEDDDNDGDIIMNEINENDISVDEFSDINDLEDDDNDGDIIMNEINENAERSKHLILTIIHDDVEEFCRLLKKETENDVDFIYENHYPDFNEPKVHDVLEKAGAFDDDNFRVSLLHVAAAAEDIKFVKLIVEAGCDINTCNKFDETILNIVALNTECDSSPEGVMRIESLIKFLLDSGANVNHQDRFDITPLHDAAEIHNPSIARMLIAKGADVNKCDDLGATPLHVATCDGSISVVELLLDNGADIYNTNSEGETPFTMATQRDDDSIYDIMKLLLEKKGKCYKTSSYASKALLLALSNCDLDTIKLLSDYGAHLTEVIQDNSTLFSPIIVEEHYRENFTKLHYAAKNQHVDVIKYILDDDIDINVRSATDLTPLHIAADYGRSEGCKFLLSRGANVNCIDDHGHTPLYLAMKSTNFRATKFTIREPKTCPDRKNNKSVRNILIAHIAKLVYLNIWVNKKDLGVIEQDNEMKCYYKNCIEELEKMKIHKFYEDINLFDILLKKDMASGYAKNEDLIEALDRAEDQLNHDFPIYHPLLKEVFYEEIKKQRLIKEAAIVLNEIFNFHHPFHLVNLKILSYLREEDIFRIKEDE